MNILGISCYFHDAAAALLKDGKIVAGAEEERFTRIKHDCSFPVNAAKWCLDEAKVSPQELDYVAFYEKPLIKFERLLSTSIDTFPWSFWQFYKAMPGFLAEKLRIRNTIRKKLKYKGPILFSEHHESHAASAFLPSPFKEAAILTVDGVGEWCTTSFGVGKDKDIELYKEIHFPHSLGLLYSTVTAYLGFSVNNSEYKVMGLAPYGKPNYTDKIYQLIDVKDDGSYRLNMKYFDFDKRLVMPSKRFTDLFGPARHPKGEMTQYYEDIAASLQKALEEVLFKILNHLHSQTKLPNLTMAGGVALNSVANGKIKKFTPFRHIWVQPAASDAGSSMGTALYAYNTVLQKPRSYVQDTDSQAYLGPGFSTAQIKKFLDDNKILHSEFKDDDEICKTTAKLISENLVVGWFQGRMEWGPRALGSRSILSNACNPEMKEILNLKVKHREKFRPFAPVITKEAVKDWFEIDKEDEKYMLFVYPIKQDKRKLIPAVTHIDGTGRLQTIAKEENYRYWRTIKEFEKITGVPIIINTSFNIRGEPIVCAPKDAYSCMMGTGIDCLIMDKFLIWRKDNLTDIWDSEALASD